MTTEPAFIEALRALAHHPAARGLDDDAAVIEFGGEALVLTHDMMVEGVHCLPTHDPADVAWKLVATNLSDLAAKGAEPVGVLLGHTLGEDDARFIEGLREVLDTYNVPLLGGDTVRSGGGARCWGLTALGRATHRPVPSRSGARAGDALYLTGPVGAAMLGFEALGDGTPEPSAAYRRPLPRLAEGRALAPLVTAMMDVSDGLLLDASRLAKASGVTLAIDSALVPVADPARRAEAMRWGDDYELLFTAPAAMALPVAAWRIGTVETAGASAMTVDGSEPEQGSPLGYQH
ncbi:thiamine-phosphate kinase [Novosphingobium colocasiae]|uniref:thiamine-phosphate kinase n=1 Tax=Novosphingobium colocasiae TaxID=1256513 RepID=UPI0035B2B4A2